MKGYWKAAAIYFIALLTGLAGCSKANENGIESVASVQLTSFAAQDAAPIEIYQMETAEGGFAPKETKPEEGAQMTAAVKEVGDGYLLVSSRTDAFPGAYYVYFEEINGIESGDEVIIWWDGLVAETSPAQIYAEAIKRR